MYSASTKISNFPAAPAILIVVGLLLAFFISAYIETVRPPLPAQYEDEDLALQGSKLKGYTLGLDGFIADWYWVRSLQYIGDKLMKEPDQDINIDDLRNLDPRLLYPYLDTATDMDPQFLAAYQYGATVLPAIDPEKAIQLCEKGIANNPNEWRLYQHLGYIYWRLGRYDKAAEVYEKGSKIAGAPSFMPMMAASMKTQGGSRDTARAIYGQMVENSGDETTRDNAKRRLLQLDALDDLDGIRTAIAKFQSANSRCPNSLSEITRLFSAQALPNGRAFRVNENNTPVDPTGVPYQFVRSTCTVGLDEAHTTIPVR
ncbi:MAG: tetratricopeptide repeat protein [Acidobacteriota bacterium]